MRTLLLCALAAGWLGAQDSVFVGPRVDALWRGPSARVHVQSGHRVYAFDALASGAWRRVKTEGRAHEVLAPDTDFHDWWEQRLSVRRTRVSGTAFARGPKEFAPLLRRPVSGAPIRLPLVHDEVALLPARDGWWVRWRDQQELERLPAPLGGDSNLGWGVGDDLVVETVAPHVLVRSRKKGRPDLLVGNDGAYVRHRKGATPTPLLPAPFDEEPGILEFPHAIPPRVADLDGDGDEDLLICDPSAGCAFLYTDLDADRPEVSRLIRLSGLLLHAWVQDLDADGRQDLLLLKLPPLGLGAQLAVLQKERVRAEALFYPGQAGGFPNSPTLRLALEIPLRISVQNELRQAEMPALVAPLPGPRLLVARPATPLELYTFEGEDPKLGKRLPKGRAKHPFRLVPLRGDYHAFAWESPTEDRVLRVRL